MVTKQPVADAFGVENDLPAANAANKDELLTLIYKHRHIELFMSGMELEDQRRFNRPVSERKTFLAALPIRWKRNDNTNIPADPAF